MTDEHIDGLIEEVGDPHSLLIGEWERLADRLDSTPFLHPGFVLAWQRAFARGPLLLATARRAGELVGVLPLVRRGAVLASPANWHTPESGVLADGDLAALALAKIVVDAGARRISLAFIDRTDESMKAFREGLADAP